MGKYNGQTLYHAFVCSWYMVFNVRTLYAVYVLATTRLDVIYGQYGLGCQYYSVWNSALQQTYFLLSLFADVAPLKPKYSEQLNRCLNLLFHFILLPSAFFVAFTFWSFYKLDPLLVDPFTPSVVDTVLEHTKHDMHTTIVPLVVLEVFISDRPFRFKNFSLIAAISGWQFLYCFVVLVLHFMGGRWPYPAVPKFSKEYCILYTFVQTLFGFAGQHCCYAAKGYVENNLRQFSINISHKMRRHLSCYVNLQCFEH